MKAMAMGRESVGSGRYRGDMSVGMEALERQTATADILTERWTPLIVTGSGREILRRDATGSQDGCRPSCERGAWW